MTRSQLGDRQAAAGVQGHAFHAAVVTILRILKWEIVAEHWRHPECGVEVDVVARAPNGDIWWIECKGSWESTRNGLIRTDTLKKAIANGALLSEMTPRNPFAVVTSDSPISGAGVKMLATAVGVQFITAVVDVRDLPTWTEGLS